MFATIKKLHVIKYHRLSNAQQTGARLARPNCRRQRFGSCYVLFARYLLILRHTIAARQKKPIIPNTQKPRLPVAVCLQRGISWKIVESLPQTVYAKLNDETAQVKQ